MSFANYDIEAQKPNGRDEPIPTSKQVTPHLNEASKNLAEFISNVGAFDKLQKQLGSKRDNSNLRQSIECVKKRIEDSQTKIEENIESLSSISRHENKDPKFHFTEERLKKQWDQVLQNYRLIYQSYVEKVKSVTVKEAYEKNEKELQQLDSERTPLLNGNSATGYDNTEEQEDDINNSQSQLRSQVHKISGNQLAYHEDVVHEREQAINHISKGVQDINKIFSDLNEVVNQQGEQIDTIESSMNDYANNNVLAHQELVKANEYQRRKRKWSCVLLLALVIILLIVLAIIS